MKYIIYEYGDGMKDMFEKYPHLKVYFDNLSLDNDFINKFLDCIYRNMEYMNNLIFKKLNQRHEYHRIGNIHVFENELTHEIYQLSVEKYRIIIESKDKSNIFFDILYHNLKSYVIIDENL